MQFTRSSRITPLRSSAGVRAQRPTLLGKALVAPALARPLAPLNAEFVKSAPKATPRLPVRAVKVQAAAGELPNFPCAIWVPVRLLLVRYQSLQ